MSGYNFHYQPQSLKPIKLITTGDTIVELGNSVNPFGQTAVWVFIGDDATPPGTGTATLELLTNDHTKDVYDANDDNQQDEWISSVYGAITTSGKFVLQQPCQRIKISVSGMTEGHYIRVLVTV